MQRTILVLSTLALLSGCSEVPPMHDIGEVPPAVAELGIYNLAAPMPNVYTAGQPTQEQFAKLPAIGIKRVLHLRLPNEPGTGWEEEGAKPLGIEFVRLPINGQRGLTRESVQQFAKLLDNGHGAPTLVSCGSSNRVGALFALKAYWVDGKPVDEAMQLGEKAGMLALSKSVRELMAEPK